MGSSTLSPASPPSNGPVPVVRLRPPRQSRAVPGVRHALAVLSAGARIARIRGEGDRVRRVLRHFFTLCSALSLALSVALCGTWVRGYRSVGVRTVNSAIDDSPAPGY